MLKDTNYKEEYSTTASPDDTNCYMLTVDMCTYYSGQYMRNIYYLAILPCFACDAVSVSHNYASKANSRV